MIERTHKQCTAEHKRRQARGRQKSERRTTEKDPSAVLVTPPPSPRLRHSIPPMSRRTRMRMLGSVALVGLIRLFSDFFPELSRLCIDFHIRAPENRIYLITLCKSNHFFFIFIIFPRRVNPKPRKLKMRVKRRHCISKSKLMMVMCMGAFGPGSKHNSVP